MSSEIWYALKLILLLIYISFLIGYPLWKYIKKDWKKDKNVLFSAFIIVSIVGILVLPIIIYIYSLSPVYGSLFILYASLLVFSLQSYFNNIGIKKEKIEKKKNSIKQRKNLLNSILHSLKNRYSYDYNFLVKDQYNDINSNHYGKLFFQPILTEGLYNHLMKLGFEPEIMDYIVLLYEQSRNIIKNIDYLNKNYNKLFEEGKVREIKEINMDIHSLYCYYYVNIFELDEFFNHKTKNIKILIGNLVDNNTSKDCLIIAKEKNVYEKLREYIA